MAGLFIRDETVNDLATEAMKIMGASSKTEAVRAALQAAIHSAKKQVPLSKRLDEARRLADQIGQVNPDYDAKADMDDLWEGR